MKVREATSVREAMKTDLLTVEREDTVREAACRMSERNLGSALVEPDPSTHGSRFGIITERDVLRAVGAGRDPDYKRVADCCTPDAVTVPPDSSLQQIAEAMTTGGFRHLVVFDGERTLGIVSIRDVVTCWVREKQLPGFDIPIREAMKTDVLVVGREETLREATRRMAEWGAAMVEPSRAGRPPGIVSAREVLHSVGAGQDPDVEHVADHLAPRMTFSAPGWSLSQAAEAMVKGGFQHILVVDATGIVGIISMRDLVRCLVQG